MTRVGFGVQILVVVVLAATWVATASGAVLCQKRSGVLVIRSACKKKEALADVAAVGLMGPKGDQGSPCMCPLASCPPDAVQVGTTCMDKYEASVWRVPAPTGINQGLVTKIQSGTATAADLAFAGATQLGVGLTDDYAPCADSGQNCTNDVYAVSLPAVLPSANITWFQAQAACKNARKRLPSNAEWQAAVMGTPDPGPDNGSTDCRTKDGFAVATGSRSACVSSDGAFDMVGNLLEWVADWVPRSTVCGTWSAGVTPTGDYQCLGGAETTGEPGALLRGGNFHDGSSSGPLSILGKFEPSFAFDGFGLRCAR